MSAKKSRPGEIHLSMDPADSGEGVRVAFIGRVFSSWTAEGTRPKNPNEARQRATPARIVINQAFRSGLRGLAGYSHVIVLAWLHEADRRALVIQPPHASEPRGVFALRSPVRPNPIGLTVCRILGVDEETGTIDIDAIDFLDQTPVVDLKPYRPGIDAFPEAVVG